MQRLEQIAAAVRTDIVRMHQHGTNVASAMSAVECLVALYFDTMHLSAPDDPERDRFILSKGHAAAALYSVLAHRRFLSRETLADFQHDGSMLAGHPSSSVPGIETATGSLGHGLAIATGLALAAKRDGKTYRVFALMGDGEIQEGSVWEAAALAASLELDNITAIVDANGLQGYGRTEERMPRASLLPKWRSFGWDAVDIDGHDLPALCNRLGHVPFTPGKPSVIVAHTIKGKGVREMEDKLGWHYFNVQEDQVDAFVSELEGGA